MPKLSAKKIAIAFYEETRGKTQEDAEKTIRGLVRFLAKKNAFKLSDKIIVEYEKYHNKMADVVKLDVKSARSLTGEMKKVIESWAEKNLNAKKVVLNETVDAEILGGVVLRHNDLLLDASVRTMINKMRKI
ncbi:MAG: F0F1 ATP synthase subunit delta [Patescibacteria group bacterium]